MARSRDVRGAREREIFEKTIGTGDVRDDGHGRWFELDEREVGGGTTDVGEKLEV